jgi:riboflavin synthase
MFTGLIEEVGTVGGVELVTGGQRFMIRCQRVLAEVQVGDSISVNGACQTVEAFDPTGFKIFSIPETLAVTNFSAIVPGARVNLERALRLGDRLGGHIVQGHVEGVARVIEVAHGAAHNYILRYESPYIIPKGSVTLNGISLTVMERMDDGMFRVQIIPETLARTNIADWLVGTEVNIEVDYVIKSLDLVQRYQPR